jgi:hypothetical protein
MPIISCEKCGKEFVNKSRYAQHQKKENSVCYCESAISCNLIIHKMDDGVIQEPENTITEYNSSYKFIDLFCGMEAFIKR